MAMAICWTYHRFKSSTWCMYYSLYNVFYCEHIIYFSEEYIWNCIGRGQRKFEMLHIVDSTDVPISEPSPFDPRWMSHKFKSAWLRYEVEISLQANIVPYSGPSVAGNKNNLQIYRKTWWQYLETQEVIIRDSTYLYPTYVMKESKKRCHKPCKIDKKR